MSIGGAMTDLKVTFMGPRAFRGMRPRMVEDYQKLFTERKGLFAKTTQEWWQSENKKIFGSEGRYIGEGWKPISKRWAALKGSSKILVDTGRLRSAMTGERYQRLRYSEQRPDSAIRAGIYMPHKTRHRDGGRGLFWMLDIFRTMVSTKARQMALYDRDLLDLMTAVGRGTVKP